MREEQSRLKEEHLCWGWALALHPGCVQEYIHCCFPPQVRAHRIVTSTDISSARLKPRGPISEEDSDADDIVDFDAQELTKVGLRWGTS